MAVLIYTRRPYVADYIHFLEVPIVADKSSVSGSDFFCSYYEVEKILLEQAVFCLLLDRHCPTCPYSNTDYSDVLFPDVDENDVVLDDGDSWADLYDYPWV